MKPGLYSSLDEAWGSCHVFVTPVKTYGSRFVFLPDEGMAWFLEIVRDRRPDEFVFLTDSGKQWGNVYKHVFKDAVRAAKLRLRLAGVKTVGLRVGAVMLGAEPSSLSPTLPFAIFSGPILSRTPPRSTVQR